MLSLREFVLDAPDNSYTLYQVEHHSSLLEQFVSEAAASGYASTEFVKPKDKVKEWHARNRAV